MNLLNYVDRFIWSAVQKQVKEDESFLLNNTQAGTITSAFLVSYTLFSPVVGLLGDRVRRKYLLSAGVGLWSLATFASGLAGSYGQLLLARGVLGVGEASYATLAPALIGDMFRRDRRNQALTIFYVAIPLGAAIGVGLGGHLGANYGWRTAFFVVGLPGLAVALAALALPDPPRGATEEVDEADLARHDALPLTWNVYARLWRTRSYVYNCLAMAMFAFALGGLQSWAPDYLVTEKRVAVEVPEQQLQDLDEEGREKKISEVMLERTTLYLGVVIAGSGLIGTLAGGWLAGRLAERIRGAYFWLSGLSVLASAPFILLGLVLHDELALFACLFVGITLASMNYGPGNTIIVNVTDPKIRAAAFAVNIFVIHILGDVSSPTLMGVVRDATGSPFLGMALTLPALAASGLFFCLGAPHLEADQDAVLKGLRSSSAAD
jgi:predicted MFS family arabinose efflux permease